MSNSNPLNEFASLIERNLPSIEIVQQSALSAGFTAWQVFVEERLKLVDEAKRLSELERLQLSCREEFCNFTRYTRNTGGDALHLPLLEKLRECANTKAGGYLLASDALMYADLTAARRYAQLTREKVSLQLRIERDRYMATVLSLVDSDATLSLPDLVRLVLHKQLGDSGFFLEESSPVCISFKKQLGPSATVFVCLNDLHHFGKVGWRGNVPLAFLADVDDSLKYSYQTGCQGTRGLPLRLQGLASGLQAYTSNINLFPSRVNDNATIILSSNEAPRGRQDVAIVLAHLALAMDCYLTFFRAIEGSLARACSEFQLGRQN